MARVGALEIKQVQVAGSLGASGMGFRVFRSAGLKCTGGQGLVRVIQPLTPDSS